MTIRSGGDDRISAKGERALKIAMIEEYVPQVL